MDVSKAFSMLQEHTEKHSNNKYQNSPINIEASLNVPQFTLLSAEKYIARYLATAGEKRAQKEDLLKACHFILFELQSKISQEAAEATKNQVKINFDPIPFSQIDNIATKTFGLLLMKSTADNSTAVYGNHTVELTIHQRGSWSFTYYGTQVMFGSSFTYHDVDRITAYLKAAA